MASSRRSAVPAFEVMAVLERVAQTASRLVNTDREAAQTQSWRRDLSADDIRDIEAVAGPLLTELGYSDDASGAEPAAPATPTSRRGGAGLLGRLDSLRRRHGNDNNAFSRGDTAQWSVDRFMEAVADRDATKAAQLLSPDVEVSFPGSGEVIAGGDLVALAQRLIDRLDVRGTQLRGDCFGGEATFTMFCTHDAGDQLVHRVFAANVAPNGSIESMSCYEIRGELR